MSYNINKIKKGNGENLVNTVEKEQIMNKSKLMKRMWEIYAGLVGDTTSKKSLALRLAYEDIRNNSKITVYLEGFDNTYIIFSYNINATDEDIFSKYINAHKEQACIDSFADKEFALNHIHKTLIANAKAKANEFQKIEAERKAKEEKAKKEQQKWEFAKSNSEVIAEVYSKKANITTQVRYCKDLELMFAVCEQAKILGKCHVSINGGKKCLFVSSTSTLTKLNYLYLGLDNETYNTIKAQENKFKSSKFSDVRGRVCYERTCWECGRKFYHEPADDGTCGEC